MPVESITAASTRDALNCIRKAKPLSGSPLIALDLVTEILRAEGGRDSSVARALVLGRCLDEICGRNLAELRGLDGTPPASDFGALGGVDGVVEDFRADHIDREAWGLVQLRFFDPSRVTLLELAERLGVSRRTLRRRLDRGHQLLADRLRALELESQPEAVPDAPAHQTVAPTLSTYGNAFVGRDADMQTLDTIWSRSRLICIVGPAGVGKSRLAQAFLDRQTEPDRQVYRLDVQAIGEARSLDVSLAELLELDLTGPASALETLVERLSGATGVLLLDGCERHREAASALADHLIERCPHLGLITTSREALDHCDRCLHELRPLDLGGIGFDDRIESLLESEAVQLLVTRLREARPDFALEARLVAPMVRVCRQLDGLPLALELAAARGAAEGLAKVAAGIDRHLELSDAQAAEARSPQSSLYAAIDWSHATLGDRSRRIFARLCVFEDRFDAGDAAAVCSDEGAPDAAIDADEIPTILEDLVGKSMLQAQPGGRSYRLLETLRSYARHRLDEDDAEVWLDRHAAHFLAQAERSAVSSSGGGLPGTSAQMFHLRADCLAVLERAVRRADVAAALGMASAMGSYWRLRGPFGEGRFWIDRALALTGGDLAIRTRLLELAGELAAMQGELELARLRFEAALSLADAVQDLTQSAAILRRLGSLADERGDVEASEYNYATALERYRDLEDSWGVAACLNNLGMLHLHAGRYARARSELRDSLRRFEALDDRWAVGVVHFNLGNVAYDQADYLAAREHYASSREVARSLDDAVGEGCSMRALGNLAAVMGDYLEARRSLRAALDLFAGIESRKHIAESIESLAAVESMEARLPAAARYFGMAEALRELIGAPIKDKDREDREKEIAMLRKTLGDELFDEAWQAGQSADWRSLVRRDHGATGQGLVPQAAVAGGHDGLRD